MTIRQDDFEQDDYCKMEGEAPTCLAIVRRTKAGRTARHPHLEMLPVRMEPHPPKKIISLNHSVQKTRANRPIPATFPFRV